MESRAYELKSKQSRDVVISAIKGHFVTKHSHVSHCIDMTKVKSQLNTAKAAAKLIAFQFAGTPVDTVITLERTKMVGAFLASELAATGINLGQDIAVISPEITDDKLILRDNFLPYVNKKRVLILTATATTGMTLKGSLEGIRYYGGDPVGAAAMFGGDFGEEIVLKSGDKVPIVRLFNAEDVAGYASYTAAECPMCRAGERIEALINSYGYSKI